MTTRFTKSSRVTDVLFMRAKDRRRSRGRKETDEVIGLVPGPR